MKSLSHASEFQADAFAIKKMKLYGVDIVVALNFMEIMDGTGSASNTHPATTDRVALMKQN